MKKLIGVILIAFMLLSCTTQSKKGDVYDTNLRLIINGKEYNTARVVPCDRCYSIWIIYPTDSTVAQPIVINYPVQNGKSQIKQAGII